MVKTLAQRSTYKTCGRSQPIQRFFSLCGISKNRNKYMRMSKIGRRLHGGHCRKSDTRIVDLALNNLAELHPELLFDSVDSSSLHVNSLHDLDVTLDHAFRRNALRLFSSLFQNFVQ